MKGKNDIRWSMLGINTLLYDTYRSKWTTKFSGVFIKFKRLIGLANREIPINASIIERYQIEAERRYANTILDKVLLIYLMNILMQIA